MAAMYFIFFAFVSSLDCFDTGCRRHRVHFFSREKKRTKETRPVDRPYRAALLARGFGGSVRQTFLVRLT